MFNMDIRYIYKVYVNGGENENCSNRLKELDKY